MPAQGAVPKHLYIRNRKRSGTYQAPCGGCVFLVNTWFRDRPFLWCAGLQDPAAVALDQLAVDLQVHGGPGAILDAHPQQLYGQ